MATNTSNQIKDAAINADSPVYISYADNSDEKPEWEHIADGVDDLKKALEAANIEYCTRIDNADDKVTDFERQIGESEVIVIVFSDLYFRTEHCMYELAEVKKSLRWHPNKKIFCVKSGTFDLSDVNYILEVEHFWGDLQQEYGEIDFHQMRKHTEQEDAAKANGFYIDEIRHLYSFFSAVNYQNMSSVNWKAFVDDITLYYNTSRALIKLTKSARKLFRRKLSLNTKLYLGGIATTLLLLIILVTIPEYRSAESEEVVEYPGYSQNDYAMEGGIITRMWLTKERTILSFSFPHSYKDTMPFSKDTTQITLKEIDEGDGSELDEYKLVRIMADPFSTEQDSSITGNNGATTDFILTFEPITQLVGQISFMDGNKGIYDLGIVEDHLVAIEHPEYERGIDNCYIHKIEINKGETKLYFRLVSDSSCTIYATNDDYIFANGKKYFLKDAAGIPIYPNRTKVAKGASVNFAMIFPPIPPETDFMHFVGKNGGIFGLKLQRETIKEILRPKSNTVLRNYLITKIEVNEDETILHVRYYNWSGDARKWRSPLNSYIVADHKKYKLESSSGLPEKTDSTAKRLDYALIFPPIPANTQKIDCIFYEDYDHKDFIGFYGLQLKQNVKTRPRVRKDSLKAAEKTAN